MTSFNALRVLLHSAIERAAQKVLAESHAMACVARRSIGQKTRYIMERNRNG